ncbi:MAG: hypothetical protein RBT11_19995 [Desulfobacterales bacterium]|jgi:hypothetical protein|nr:hypothetical protein [Desulfobacterales bacterium]
MRSYSSPILFDKRDHELIKIVNEIHGQGNRREFARKRYYSVFHPNGIKTMTESKGLRIAYAVAHLLNSLEVGAMEDRINALQMLRAEAIDTTGGPMPKNTARVLLQLMKELVRAHGDYHRQLTLAHDFRIAAFGKPRIVRRKLRRFRLLEMPEEWNQLTFDDHVHDANTKGRKTPTHLVMDAWIKGIRRLRVIHYNYIEPRFAAELFSAAKIMGIDIRVGIEFYGRYRDKYVQLIWVPRGFADTQDFLCFLAEPHVMTLMDQGREASEYQQRHVMELLKKFNVTYRQKINAAYDLVLPAIDEAAFLKFVGAGQKSKVHLSEYIQNLMVDALQIKLDTLSTAYGTADASRRKEIDDYIQTMNTLDIEATIKSYLTPDNNPEIVFPEVPHEEKNLPELMRLSAPEVLNRLAALRSGYRITLNLTNLKVDEVLELLYDCEGGITRLEIFNLKDYTEGITDHLPDINRLQQAVNHESLISLKHMVRGIISQVESADYPDKADRIAKLTTILHDLPSLKLFYQETPLKSRIGSDSTGRSFKAYGMGFAIKETLPLRAQREIHWRRSEHIRKVLPLRINAYPTSTYIPYRTDPPIHPLLYRFALMAPFFNWIGFSCQKSWQVESSATKMAQIGNIVTLGGIRKQEVAGYSLEKKIHTHKKPGLSWKYLNTRIKNALKVLLGFIPAFATFALTKDWWVLAYLGAFIWFGITGIRNIIQSVLGGGGFRRSPLLRWNNYISWDRLTDSLLYTGFSVPLLDYLVKTVILDSGFGITTANHAVLLYTFMAIANGIYLFTHNILRGLPKAAAYGNLLRSILSIPIAVALNSFLGILLPMFDVVDPSSVLQKWAAIISKTASDFVAGIIEGLADRYANIRARLRDYRQKFNDMLNVYAELELLFPDMKTFKLLETTAAPKKSAKSEAAELEHIIMLHALDFLYFWMYQPRARSALAKLFATLTEDERHILVSSQFSLQRHREISQLFIDGIFGNNFPKPLSFYLSRYPGYLEDIKQLGL